ncbi:MAG: ABC-F family ATP-binding cassette domain-containing protein [Clostridia bacterium]|nr:ABC-F family ATP-binding cassette domain-containing protein [Clostridia bacterium]
MIVLNCNNISLSFGTNTILENITFNLQESEKVGLVGVNGAGKSTLFKIISGILQPDCGEIYLAKGYKLAFLEQNTGLDSSNTIWDEMLSTYAHLIEIEERIKNLEEKIGVEKNEDRLSSLVKEYSNLTDKYSMSGGYEYTSKVRGVLRGLGFTDNQFALKIETLSGGQKTRLALAKLLLSEPDILLMDEPTNHLDISAIEWLEEFLRNYKKCVFIISHDRYFLDAVTSKTIELENCGCKVYNGNYTAFINQKAVDREIQQKHYDLQQKEISRMEAFIEQQKRWNREKNIIAAESRQKAIDRMEKIDKPKNLPGKIKIKFRTDIISGNDVLFVENLSMEYPGKPLFKNINFKLKKSERVFLLGPNGCGKSTLLKILTGKVAHTSGVFEYGHKVQSGYYDQEHDDLDDSNTIIDEVWNSNEKLTQTELRTALASFLFKGEDVFKPISILSGGEKGRVALVKLMLSDSNLLILDEPTNHLDINSREVLEESLKNFDGTILAVSHDRYFINKLASRILELDNNSLFDYSGNYQDYTEYKNKMKKTPSDSNAESKISASKLERLATKEEKTKQRRLEKQISETEREIGEIEERLVVLESEMQALLSDHIKLTELHNEQNFLKSKLEELYTLWETLSSEKESMA